MTYIAFRCRGILPTVVAAILLVATPCVAQEEVEFDNRVWKPKPLWADIRLVPEQLRFERPSDVLAMWRQWRPEDDDLLPRPVRDDVSYAKGRRLNFLCSTYHVLRYGNGKKGCLEGEFLTAEDHFDDEAAAFVALGVCLPDVAWVMHEMSPMLWVVEKGGFWNHGNNGGNLDFGSCVRKHSPVRRMPDPEQDSADTPLGARAAAVLERKLADYLMAYQCAGSGPDDCLTLLDALRSLSPQSTRLPAVLDALASNFEDSTKSSIPQVVVGHHRALSGKAWEDARSVRRELMRRALYLTQRLRVFAGLPDERIPPGEPSATLVKLVPIAEDLLRLDTIQGTRWPRPRLGYPWPFADPWATVTSAASRSELWDHALAHLGAEVVRLAASNEKCPTPPMTGSEADKLPGAYWRGHWIASLELGLDGCQRQGGCEPQRDPGWVRAYSSVAGEGDKALSEFSPLRRFVGDENRADAHLALVLPLAEKCPLESDPWGLCAWVGDAEHQRWSGRPLRRLPLSGKNQFSSDSLEVTGLEVRSRELRLDVALALLRRREDSVPYEIQSMLANLQAARGVPQVKARWWHPSTAIRALQITVRASSGSPEPEERMLLLYGGSASPRLVRLIGSFGQYADGRVAALSDLDGDERPEVWFAAESRACDGEGVALGGDCPPTQYGFGGEVFGDRLGPYLVGPSPASPAP